MCINRMWLNSKLRLPIYHETYNATIDFMEYAAIVLLLNMNCKEIRIPP